MAHRIAVIGGDGIGPEVTAEAVKVVRAAGVDLDTTDFDLGGPATCATARSSPTRRSTSCAASTRSCSARSARPRCRRA